MPTPVPEDVRAALAAGKKIDAIRLLRARTGLGLAQAKAAVESGFVPDATTPQQGLAGSLPAEVQAALAGGHVLQAIKMLRQAKGVGLKQAKAMADEASRAAVPRGGQTGQIVQRGDGPSPGEVPRSKLSPGLVLLVVVLAVAAWLLLGQVQV
jgi:ribosomal protein L7/L12